MGRYAYWSTDGEDIEYKFWFGCQPSLSEGMFECGTLIDPPEKCQWNNETYDKECWATGYGAEVVAILKAYYGGDRDEEGYDSAFESVKELIDDLNDADDSIKIDWEKLKDFMEEQSAGCEWSDIIDWIEDTPTMTFDADDMPQLEKYFNGQKFSSAVYDVVKQWTPENAEDMYCWYEYSSMSDKDLETELADATLAKLIYYSLKFNEGESIDINFEY